MRHSADRTRRMTLAGESGMRLASEHRPMGWAPIWARRGGAGPSAGRWNKGGNPAPRGQSARLGPHIGGAKRARRSQALADLTLPKLHSMTNLQSMTNDPHLKSPSGDA